jgi:4-hydroxymandelate oxidase
MVDFPLGPARTLKQYRDLARAALDPAVWDYLEGGAEDELTLRENRRAFARMVLRPRVLAEISEVDLSCSALGVRLETPIAIAPIGFRALFHADGELATARAAASQGALMTVSTMASSRLEDIAHVAAGPLWFQLYVMKDRDQSSDLVRRAEAAGYRAVVLTVDAPRLGRRERDLHNGFAIPPTIQAANLSSAASTGLWERRAGESGIARHAAADFETKLSWQLVPWIRQHTRLPLVLKGVLTAEDARRARDSGVDGLIVSNHGGRQLDGAIASLDALAEVIDAAGQRCEVYLDGGVRRGVDALKALALGARLVFLGRPTAWGLAAAGETGVRDVLRIASDELRHAMILAGQGALAALTPALVRAARA